MPRAFGLDHANRMDAMASISDVTSRISYRREPTLSGPPAAGRSDRRDPEARKSQTRRAPDFRVASLAMSKSPPGSRPGYYEFFCGGGMARAGLGPGWACLYAGDIDAGKAASYAANWGAEALHVGDVADLRAADLAGRADLAWASFPCQDLSLAGAGAGLDGRRSSAFWGFHALMRGLRAQGRAPRVIALENVLGAVTSKASADFIAISGALSGIGYRVGALILDAAAFLPQSRPRVFFIALDRGIEPPPDLVSPTAPARHTTPALRRAASLLPASLAADWLWWRAPEPPRANLSLIDVLDAEPADVDWHRPEQTSALLAALSPASRREVALARASGARRVGALFRRTRPDGLGGVRVQAEARFDGLAGCLRTPGGGSSRQFVIEIEGERARTRLIGPQEAARLMGLPESYRLPERASAAFHLIGDGVAVPVVRFLSEALLLPLVGRKRPPRRRRAGAARVTSPERSATMRAVKSRDTGAERAVRAILHDIAPGYRLNRADLPGKPDIVYAGAGWRFSCTAASGMGTIARAARGCPKPMPPTGEPRSPAIAPAMRERWLSSSPWAGERSSSTNAN